MSWKKHISSNLLLTLVLSQVSAVDTSGPVVITPNGPNDPLTQQVTTQQSDDLALIFGAKSPADPSLGIYAALGSSVLADYSSGAQITQLRTEAVSDHQSAGPRNVNDQPAAVNDMAGMRVSRASSRHRSSTISNSEPVTPGGGSTSSRASAQNTVPMQLSEYLNKVNIQGCPFSTSDNYVSFTPKMEPGEWLSRIPYSNPKVDLPAINNFNQKVLSAMWGNKILAFTNGEPVTWKPSMGHESSIYMITRLPHNDLNKRDGLAAYPYNQCILGTYLASHLFCDRSRENDRRLDIGTEATILGLAHILQQMPQLPDRLHKKYFFVTSARDVVVLNDQLSDFEFIIGINGGIITNDRTFMVDAHIPINGSTNTIDFPLRFIRDSIPWKTKYTLNSNKLFKLNNTDLTKPDLQMVCVDMIIDQAQALKRCHLIELLAYYYSGSLVANIHNFDNFNFKVIPIDSNKNLFRLVLTDFSNIISIDGIPEIYDKDDTTRSIFKGCVIDVLENYVTKSIKNQFPTRAGFGFPQRVTFA